MTEKSLPKAASPEHLTAVLRKSFIDVRVSDVTIESSHPTILSEITRLRLVYEADALGAPRTLILKTGRPDRLGDANWDAGRQEAKRWRETRSPEAGHPIENRETDCTPKRVTDREAMTGARRGLIGIPKS